MIFHKEHTYSINEKVWLTVIVILDLQMLIINASSGYQSPFIIIKCVLFLHYWCYYMIDLLGINLHLPSE